MNVFLFHFRFHHRTSRLSFLMSDSEMKRFWCGTPRQHQPRGENIQRHKQRTIPALSSNYPKLNIAHSVRSKDNSAPHSFDFHCRDTWEFMNRQAIKRSRVENLPHDTGHSGLAAASRCPALFRPHAPILPNDSVINQIHSGSTDYKKHSIAEDQYHWSPLISLLSTSSEHMAQKIL